MHGQIVWKKRHCIVGLRDAPTATRLSCFHVTGSLPLHSNSPVHEVPQYSTKVRELLANGETHAKLQQLESYVPHAYPCRLQHSFCIVHLLILWSPSFLVLKKNNFKLYICLDSIYRSIKIHTRKWNC